MPSLDIREFHQRSQRVRSLPEGPIGLRILRLTHAIKQGRRCQSSDELQAPAETIAQVFNEIAQIQPKAVLLFSEGTCFANSREVKLGREASEQITELQQLCQLRGLGGFKLSPAKVAARDTFAMLHAWRSSVPQGTRVERYRGSVKLLHDERRRLRLNGPSPFTYVPIDKVQHYLADRSMSMPLSSRKAMLLFARLLTRTRLALEKVAKNEPCAEDIRALQRVLQDIIEDIDNDVFRSRLLAWTYLRGVERLIVHHNASTAVFALCAARECGLERSRMAAMGMAAIFHDTMFVKDNPQGHRIWAVPTRNALERSAFSRSVLYQMVLPYEQMQLSLLDLNPLEDDAEVFLESHILGVANTLDRAMREAYTPPYQALRMLAIQGQYDKAAIAAFVAALGVYPRGSVVRLSDGRLAVVLENGRHRLHRPVVLLLQRKDGTVIKHKHFIDLLDPNAPRIEGALDERHLGLNLIEAVLEGTTDDLDDD